MHNKYIISKSVYKNSGNTIIKNKHKQLTINKLNYTIQYANDSTKRKAAPKTFDIAYTITCNN
ncbi:hypothetical protein DBR40_13295 [Pedobacter sp. KBW01]|nr:hypothetical protein DBR40_13295 [Pedobacter sp. KBW01]